MKHLLFITALICSIALNGYAQQVPSNKQPKSFSLADCINYAYQHQDSVVNAGLDIKSADYKVKETIGTGLPQISGSITFQDFLKAPISVGPDFKNFATTGQIDKNAKLLALP